MAKEKRQYDVIIVGSGPAGLTAGIYAVRGGLSTLILAGTRWGGQLMLTTEVENYPGFVSGIRGPELMEAMKKQAIRLGAEVVELDAESVNFKNRPFSIKANNQEYAGKAVIVATGADTRWLGVPGEGNLIGRGVSSCAPCDAAFFKDKKVVVAGGGDSAMEEASFLTKFASEVTIIHRRDKFRASQAMQKTTLSNPKVKTKLNSNIVEILGEQKVTGVKIKDEHGLIDFPIDGVFVAIGQDPNTNIFSGELELDRQGYVKKVQNTKYKVQNENGEFLGYKYNMMTSREGVFVAGDVHDINYRQAITAAGFGCQAALETIKWLGEDAGF